jgi:hypothetical protein
MKITKHISLFFADIMARPNLATVVLIALAINFATVLAFSQVIHERDTNVLKCVSAQFDTPSDTPIKPCSEIIVKCMANSPGAMEHLASVIIKIFSR